MLYGDCSNAIATLPHGDTTCCSIKKFNRKFSFVTMDHSNENVTPFHNVRDNMKNGQIIMSN